MHKVKIKNSFIKLGQNNQLMLKTNSGFAASELMSQKKGRQPYASAGLKDRKKLTQLTRRQPDHCWMSPSRRRW